MVFRSSTLCGIAEEASSRPQTEDDFLDPDFLALFLVGYSFSLLFLSLIIHWCVFLLILRTSHIYACRPFHCKQKMLRLQTRVLRPLVIHRKQSLSLDNTCLFFLRDRSVGPCFVECCLDAQNRQISPTPWKFPDEFISRTHQIGWFQL